MDVIEKQIRGKKDAVKDGIMDESDFRFRIRSREDARRMVIFSELMKPKFD